MSFSDVAIAMLKADYYRLQQAIEELSSEMKQCVDKLFKGAAVVESAQHREYVIIHWQWVKWNDHYPEIQFLQHFLTENDKYDYIRIGVEYDDVECIFHTGEDVIAIEHKIKYTAGKSIPTKDKVEVSKIEYDILWKNMVSSLKENPRDIITRPLNKTGIWFYAYAEDENIFVKNSIDHSNSCKIKGRRRIEKNEFSDMLSIYHRRCNGERVSKEAGEITYCQVYWYGLFAEFSL